MTLEWNKVTWYSKTAAVVLFVLTLFIGFKLGEYNAQTSLLSQAEIIPIETPVVVTPIKPLPPVVVGSPKESGTLKGTMTIGPVCPVEQEGKPCKPTAEMYANNKVFVYTFNRAKLVATLTPDADGLFSAILPIGIYIVDVKSQPIGFVSGAPKTIHIRDTDIVNVPIDIDTGIR